MSTETNETDPWDEDLDEQEEQLLTDGEPIDDASDLIKFEDDDEEDFQEISHSPSLQQQPQQQMESCRGLAKSLEPLVALAAPINHPAVIRSRLIAMSQFRESVPSAPFCRICRDPDPGQPAQPAQALVSPCLCKGSVAQVHISCLERWLAESDSTCCELCGCPYRTIRTPRYHVLTSIPVWAASVGGSELLFDLFALAVFTPVALFGTYLGVNADDSAYVQMSLMAAIDLVYSAWLVMRLHYHFTRWHSWWRRKFTVKLILDKTPSKHSLNESL